MTGRTTPCDRATRRGRLDKARQFAEVAHQTQILADGVPGEVADAFVTLAVHAGIAASDVICCVRLGEHARGESHSAATALLATADRDVAKHLSTLLQMKTTAGYSAVPASAQDMLRAARAMDARAEEIAG
ncbi:hypothetical protein IF651_05345 [Cellulosimicrobium arenosum]|uniref:Uncharacterized protein n=1 Tax=Cellulosimicrobium arenosum TaxID=2708133 RepID=A0A927G855_9MICO|nr:hypothetical protein [Cellulosimicrobium arenosum]